MASAGDERRAAAVGAGDGGAAGAAARHGGLPAPPGPRRGPGRAMREGATAVAGASVEIGVGCPAGSAGAGVTGSSPVGAGIMADMVGAAGPPKGEGRCAMMPMHGGWGAAPDPAQTAGKAAWMDAFMGPLLGTALRARPSATLLDVSRVLAGWWAARQHPGIPGRSVLDAEAARRICRFRMEADGGWMDPSSTVESALPPGSTMRLYGDGRHWATVKMREYVGAGGMEKEGPVEAVGDRYDIAIAELEGTPWSPSPAAFAELKPRTIGEREFLPLLRAPAGKEDPAA